VGLAGFFWLGRKPNIDFSLLLGLLIIDSSQAGTPVIRASLIGAAPSEGNKVSMAPYSAR